MQWMHDHAQLISTAANIGMLLVWLAYLHVFYLSWSRERRVRVLIQQAGGTASNARCQAVNMSSSSVDIACILIAALKDGNEYVYDLESIATDVMLQQKNSDWEVPRPRHGPIPPGGTATVGSFDELLDAVNQALQSHGDKERLSLEMLEVRLVFFYQTYDQPIGAQRCFYVDRDEHRTHIRPENARTRQLVSRRDRQQAEYWYMQGFR